MIVRKSDPFVILVGDGPVVSENGAEIEPTLYWAKLYGPTIGSTVKHLCVALRGCSDALTTMEQIPSISLSLARACQAVARLHEQREEKRQVSVACVNAVLGKSFHSEAKKVLGISTEDYACMDEDQLERFWENYWLLRDRLSTTVTTLTTLFISTCKVADAVTCLVHHRASLSSVDIDRLELAKQVAITKAGGHATNYQVGQLN